MLENVEVIFQRHANARAGSIPFDELRCQISQWTFEWLNAHAGRSQCQRRSALEHNVPTKKHWASTRHAPTFA
jgi:hypothetical protein